MDLVLVKQYLYYVRYIIIKIRIWDASTIQCNNIRITWFYNSVVQVSQISIALYNNGRNITKDNLLIWKNKPMNFTNS